jgi:hypothetical protein
MRSMRISVAPFVPFKKETSPLIAPNIFTALGYGIAAFAYGSGAEEYGEGIARGPVADISDFYRIGRGVIQGFNNWNFEIELISPFIGHCTNGQRSCNSPSTRGIEQLGIKSCILNYDP